MLCTDRALWRLDYVAFIMNQTYPFKHIRSPSILVHHLDTRKVFDETVEM